jgi:methylenetetrahydrofolate--tRNA-(uracil-5-)-methyltransferase
MHKNTYIQSPKVLKETFQMKEYPNVFFAGQISGVEGYVESIASGLVAGRNMYNYLNDKSEILFDKHTIIGALCKYIAYKVGDFEPMSANMGLINYNEFKIKDKKEKNQKLADISLEKIKELIIKENL